MLFSTFYRAQKIKNITKIEKKETAFVYILGFIFYGVSHLKIDLHNKYTIKFVWFIFWTKSCIKINYFRSLCETMV